MPHPSSQKTELRQAILERLQNMNDASRAAESRSIVRRILELLPAETAVCAYVPMKTEPDLRPLLEELLRQGRPVYLPAGSAQSRSLTMRRIAAMAELVPGSYGIPEPPASAPVLDPALPITVLVPGRAFDTRGGRLGRGNGGYDRWIRERRAHNAATQFLGVAFACQLVPEVPMEEHDEHLDGVVTARGVTKAF